MDKAGSHSRRYLSDDFDYYALYLPQVDRVVYPAISFRGGVINPSVPPTYLPFYWYEDFLDLTGDAQKRTYRDFEGATGGNTTGIAKQYGVTDNAIAKWAKSYGLSKPPRGYWTKQQGQADVDVNTER